MKVEVVKYQSRWPELYMEEEEKIRKILKGNLVEIYHIGSTAVPGLMAKPIIDIMPVVNNLYRVDEKNTEFEKIGYECMGEFGIEGRRYFRKGGDHRTHQIHIFQKENVRDIRRHLAVRDYLIAHPETAEQYGALKSELARRYPENIEAYCDGKDAFVKKMEQDALVWSAKKK